LNNYISIALTNNFVDIRLTPEMFSVFVQRHFGIAISVKLLNSGGEVFIRSGRIARAIDNIAPRPSSIHRSLKPEESMNPIVPGIIVPSWLSTESYSSLKGGFLGWKF
jgi:hypothetical protein